MADELPSGEEIVDEMIQERREGSDFDDEDSLFHELNVWADYLTNLSLKRSKQATLDRFFVR